MLVVVSLQVFGRGLRARRTETWPLSQPGGPDEQLLTALLLLLKGWRW